MNTFELNKVLGAILGTCLVLVAVHIAAGALFTPVVPAKPGYEIAVKKEQPPQAETKAPTAEQSFDNMLATASVGRGAEIAKQCEICHNVEKGQGPKVGPDLYDVVGRKVASVAGFNYSTALKAKGGTWTFDALNTWLTNPQADVPGTAMTFAGLSNEKQRADVIAYLNTLSAHPQPLPVPQKEAKQEQPAQPEAKAPTAEQSFDNMLATASVGRGAEIAKQCEICHNVEKGQGPKVGPDLYDVVGRKVASVTGFNYSTALKAKGGTWTFDALNTWLTNPQADVPGTAMTFAGLSNEKQRADVIAYLNTLSDHPQPLPSPKRDTEAAPANQSSSGK
jgi:cytochrome c